MGLGSTLGKVGLGLVGGVAGASPSNSTTTTTGNQNTSGETQSNSNQVSYQDLTTFLSNLLHGTTSQQGTSTTGYNLDPGTQQLLSQLLGRAGSIAQPFNTQNYQAGQVQSINKNADLQSQAIQNINASRGIQGPAAATSLGNVENERFANINKMEAQTPFVKQQFDLNNLLASLNIFSQAPKGTTTSTTGQTQQDTSQNTMGNNVIHGSQGQTGYTSNQQATNTNQTATTRAGGGLGGFAGGLAGTLASLFQINGQEIEDGTG